MQINEVEIWLPIEGYEGYYEASSFGNIRSLDRLVVHSTGTRRVYKGTKLVPGLSNEYLNVQLSKGGKQISIGVHILICNTFYDNPENKKTVNHKDGNKLNNREDNLEFATSSEQHIHAHRTGLKGMNSRALNINQAKEIKSLISAGVKAKDISSKYNISVRTVFNIKSGFTWNKA